MKNYRVLKEIRVGAPAVECGGGPGKTEGVVKAGCVMSLAAKDPRIKGWLDREAIKLEG